MTEELSKAEYLYQELTKRTGESFKDGDLKALEDLRKLDPEKAETIDTFRGLSTPKPPALPKKGCLKPF